MEELQAVEASELPEQLKKLKQWVCWKYEDRGGKPTKVPYTIGGYLAGSTKPSDWYSYKDVEEARDEFDGIGFVFSEADDFVGIDLDDCFVDGEIQEWAEPIIEKLSGTYGEISPSGNGLKYFLRGELPLGKGKNVKVESGAIEAYEHGRYFTVTGVAFSQSREVTEQQETIDWLFDTYFKQEEPKPLSVPLNAPSLDLSLEDKISRASKYLAQVDPAVGGQNAAGVTYRAACTLARGFALPENEVFNLLLNEYNPRCLSASGESSPWTEQELRRKASEGMKSNDALGSMLTVKELVIDQGVDLSQLLSWAPEAHKEAIKAREEFEGRDITELEQFKGKSVDWLVDWVFSSDQPTLFGARSKAGKTTQLVDLSVALATKTDWLGYFTIPRARKVLFITGESNEMAITKRLVKAFSSRGLDFQDAKGMLRVEAVNFPLLPSEANRAQIAKIVRKHDIEVVIIDPLYRGLGQLDTHRMAEVGQAIVSFTKACAPASLIISHHTTKSAARETEGPPQLEDMSGAGIAESCGNWWLLGRNEKYKADGMHDLCVGYGGRDEQSGYKRIVFNENLWTWEVGSLADFQDQRQEDRQQAKAERKNNEIEEAIRRAKGEIEKALMNEKTPLSKTAIRTLCPMAPEPKHRAALAEMIKQLVVAEAPYIDKQDRKQNNGFILQRYCDDYMDQWHNLHFKEWEERKEASRKRKKGA